MNYLLLFIITMQILSGLSTNTYAQGGSRSIQPPDFCTAFPEDPNCKDNNSQEGVVKSEEVVVDNLPSPLPVTTEPVVDEAQQNPTIPEKLPDVQPTPTTVTPLPPVTDNTESQMSKENDNVTEKESKSNSKKENRVLIGLVKIGTSIYLFVTGMLFLLFSIIGVFTYLSRRNKNLGPIPKAFWLFPLISGGFMLVGFVVLYILQII